MNEPTIEQQIDAMYIGTGCDWEGRLKSVLRRLAADMRGLQQILPAMAAKIVVRKSEQPLTKTELETGVKMVDEYIRLQKLSNRQLVEEATNSDAADYMIVSEMMSRLDPDWSKENRPPEQPLPPSLTNIIGGPDAPHTYKPSPFPPEQILEIDEKGKVHDMGTQPPAPAETPVGDILERIGFDPALSCNQKLVAEIESYIENRLGQSQQLAPDAKPVAWMYETARSIDHSTQPPTYLNWGAPQVSFGEPHVPEGSFRNLVALYTHPSPDAIAEAVRKELIAGLKWTEERWTAEVGSRPEVNVYRDMLDKTWRQIKRYLRSRLAELKGGAQ